RVHGVTGLRVADTSIFPLAPSRGPAATAIMAGERIADFIRTGADSPTRPTSRTVTAGPECGARDPP
ncbi:MAG: GMC oxidoreductase, partial [Streptosporangiaceae bacterium]